jgi:hypothetical protein
MTVVRKPLNLSLYIEPGYEVDDDELDRLTRQLMGQIRTLEVESVELIREGPAPEGSKSAEAVTLGALAMAVLPVAVPPLLSVVQSWLLRDQNRKVKLETEIEGRRVMLEYSGSISQDELKTLRTLLLPQ